MIVVDTNIISYLFLPSKFSELTEELISKDPHWIAPILWRSEFRNVLAGYIRNDLIEFEDATTIMNRAENLLYESEYQVSSISVLNLVLNSNCSAYDCEYIALAKQTKSFLVTQDEKVIKNFPETAFPLDSIPNLKV